MSDLLLAGAPTGCWTNLGDEAILAGMVEELRAAVPGVQITVVASSPAETYVPYGCAAVRFNDLPALAAAVAGCQAVVLGGGSIFFDYWGCDAADVLTPRHQGLSLWTGLALLAAAHDKPVVTYGVGVGPVRTADGMLMARAVFDVASAITVRDSGSAELLAQWGVRTAVTVTGDPAITVTLPSIDVDRRGPGPLIGVALREWETGIDPGRWNTALAAAVDGYLSRTGGTAVFVPCHRTVRWPLTDDTGAAQAVVEVMRNADRASVISVDLPWRERASILAGCDSVLAMRYHAALFALRAGVRTVGLSYDPKVAGLFADWGLRSWCLDLGAAQRQPQRIVDLLADGRPLDDDRSGTDATAIGAGATRMLRAAGGSPRILADVLNGAPDPVRTRSESIRRLLTRMSAGAADRPAAITAALDRLAADPAADLAPHLASDLASDPAPHLASDLASDPAADPAAGLAADRAADGAGSPPRRRTVAILTNRLLHRDTGAVQVGGAERYALALAQLLRDVGLDVEFYQGGGSFAVGDFYGFPVHPIPFGEAVSEFQIGVAAEFHRRTASADHVIYLMPNYASGPMRDDAVVVSHGVWWDHDLWPHLSMRSPQWRAQLERVFARAARVISVDANTINVVRALFPAAAARMRHIPSAVDTAAFCPPVTRGGPAPMVLFPRRAEAIRGAHLVGPVLDLVPDPCRFRWIGDGDPAQVAALRAVADRDARLTVGDAAFDAMPAQYADADICVIPTMASEGQSLSCLEAMASGCAVVVTRVGGLPELVTDDVDGLVCEPTAESLAAAIRRLVRDPALRARLGAQARRTAQRHGIDRWRAAWAEELVELGWIDRRAIANAVPYDVVCFAIIDWEQRYQRPQQLAAAWGRRGRRVFYLRVTDHLPPDGPPVSVRPLAEGVYEVRLALPPGLDLHFGMEPAGLVPAAIAALDALRARFGIDRAVSVVDLGTWRPVAEAARETFGWPLVYDCMDDWSTFPGFADRTDVLDAERTLVASADAMVVSGRALLRRWSPVRPDVVLARNAADFDFFHDAGTSRHDGDQVVVPAPIADIVGPVAGFFGAVVEWFDVELVRMVALARPDVTFVFAGDIARVSLEPLQPLDNVRFLGPQPYEDLPAYLRRFDVCLVPFLVNPVTASMDLVKVYEYLAQGKPVVCTPVAEMVPYAPYLYLADGPTEFVAQLNRALAEDDPGAVRRRVALARMNSWQDRLDVIEHTMLAVLALGGDADRGAAVTATVVAATAAAHSGAGSDVPHGAFGGPDEAVRKARRERDDARCELARLKASRAVRLSRRYRSARGALGRVVARARNTFRRGRHRP